MARAINWRAELKGPVVSTDDLAQRILSGLAQAGVHRALVDLNNWTLLKWLDEPCTFYDWRGSETRRPKVHPDDEHLMSSMTTEFADSATSRVLRMPGHDAAWAPVHVTLNRIELEPGIFVGLVSLRLPSDEELAAAGLAEATDEQGLTHHGQRPLERPKMPRSAKMPRSQFSQIMRRTSDSC